MLMEGITRLLLLFSLLPTPPDPAASNDQKYAVIFDGGSTASRVHVFSFDSNMNLLPIGNDFELYLSTKPGLSSYENDPKAAAESLRTLLEQAEAAVPQELRPKTPLRLGATAGLRLLPGNSSEAILDAVRQFFKNESSLHYKAEWVNVIDGTDEGTYVWEAINYLLGAVGKGGSKTAAVVDLGGGSVQMTYAVTEESAKNAPEGYAYVADKLILGTKYHLYTHSYLNYGQKAARAQNLELTGGHGNPCIINGYSGTYEYSEKVYNVSSPKSGTSLRRCRALTRKILKTDAPCPHKKCSFNGVWNGGGGDGLSNLYVVSSYYYSAVEAGIMEEDASKAVVRPIAYRNAARRACRANVDNIMTIFPLVEEDYAPYLCMDLVYEYTLLVDGFGLDPFKEITVAQGIEYKGTVIDASWPLGCAVELLSA